MRTPSRRFDATPGHAYAFDLRSGGIISLHAGHLTVTASGVITASGTHIDYRQAYAGGSVMLRGDVIDFSAGQVTAPGGDTDPMFGELAHHAGDGCVSISYSTSVTGTSTPAAFTSQRADP